MRPVLIGASLGGGALLMATAVRKGWLGDRLVLYSATGDAAAEFRARAAEVAQAIGGHLYPVTSGAGVLQAIQRHSRISRLVFVGHGTTSSFFFPGAGGIRVGTDALPAWLSIEHLAAELAKRLVTGAVIGFAGCSAGANPGFSEWGVHSYGGGGEASLAARLRDAISQRAVFLWGAEIRAHTAPGGTIANPTARVFPIGRFSIGQPGRSLLNMVLGTNAHLEEGNRDYWVETFRGAKAAAWIAGE